MREVRMELKEARKAVEKFIKYADEVMLTVGIYNFPESESNNDMEGWDVEIKAEADGETEFFTLDTFYNGKEAQRRAKTVLRTIKGWTFREEAEVAEAINEYSL